MLQHLYFILVMLGHKGGTAVRLERMFGRPLHKVWCGAHKIDIVLGNGFHGQPKKDPPIQGVPGSKDMEKIINTVYTM